MLPALWSANPTTSPMPKFSSPLRFYPIHPWSLGVLGRSHWMNFGGWPHCLRTSKFPGFSDKLCHREGWRQSRQFCRLALKTWPALFGLHEFCAGLPLQKTSKHVFPEPEDPTICLSHLWTGLCTKQWNHLPVKALALWLALMQRREPGTKF